MIDGFEYYVFSDADYAWPPLPELFWGGKKVRLSAEGFLVFRWDGQDVPVYDFKYNLADSGIESDFFFMTARVLLVADHSVMQQGLRVLLGREEDIKAVRVAGGVPAGTSGFHGRL